jgi:hypothetical protein
MAEFTDSAALAARIRRLADELVDVGEDMVRMGEHGAVVDTGHYLIGCGECARAWASVIDKPAHEHLAEPAA